MGFCPRAGRRTLARVAAPVLVLLAASPSASGGLVFREVETDDSGAASGSTRIVRRVFADGENCKVLVEESSDPQMPRGSYVLATGGSDAFVIDPARRTMTPVVPAEMQPVAEPSGDHAPGTVTATVEPQLDEPGPPILGLPTRHYLYRLRIQEQAAAGSAVSTVARSEERHEFWATSLPEGEQPPVAWQALRVVDDAGRSSAPREARQAIEQMYQHGLVLRQIVEWHGPGASDSEKVVREVTELSRDSIPSDTFQKPAGLTQTEDLAPRSEEN